MSRPRSVVRRLLTLYGVAVVASLSALAFAVGDDWPLFVGVGLAVAVAGGLIAAVVLHRNIVVPVRHMVAATRKLASGSHSVRLEVADPAELAELAASVNLVGEQLGAGIESVRRGQQQLLLTLDSLDDGVVLVDAEDNVVYVNRPASEILPREVLTVRELTPLPARALVLDTREAGERSLAEFEIGRPASVISARCTPIGDEGVLLLVMRDVTEQKRLLAARRKLVEDASHELKTPVATLRALAETVVRAMENDPARARHFGEEMELEAERLGRVVTDLLDLSRLETEMPDMVPVALHELIDGVAKQVLSGTRYRSSLEPLTIDGDEEGLVLAVRNVLDNAVRYGGDDVEVAVTLERSAGEAVITVTDDGPGIPTSDQPRIFERFYRVDRARSRATGGTGLGLAIVRHVLLQHGGKVEVDSTLGEGSTFRLMIPVSAGHSAADSSSSNRDSSSAF